MKNNILLFILLLFAAPLFSQTTADKLFEDKHELILKFQITDKEQFREMAPRFSIDKVDGDEAVMYANKREFEDFLSLNIPYEVVEKTVLSEEEMNMMTVEMIQKNRSDWNFYPTYEAYVEMMYQFETDYPELCETLNFGTTTNGRELLACKISKNVGEREAEPQFFWTSTMHGDETTGYVLMLRLIDYLLSNYGTDGRITHLLDNMEIWINPLANPDGTYRGGNHTVNGSTRYNGNNEDINRNFKDNVYGDHPDGATWQPETLAFMELQAEQHFVMACNIHGGAEVCNYPWDNSRTRHADDEWWKFVCREYADTAHLYAPSGYMTYMQNGITNGSDWYMIGGGRQDYANYYDHTKEFCLEISNTKNPSASQLPNFWTYNWRSFLNYTEQALYGIQGTITAYEAKETPAAKIEILNHDNTNSYVLSDPRTGFYVRPVKAGTYTVVISALEEGYFPDTLQITVADRTPFEYHPTLYEEQPPIPDFESDTTLIKLGEPVTFSDLSICYPSSWEWRFEGGTPATSTAKNPVVTYSEEGNFNVELIARNEFGERSILKEALIKARIEPKPPIADFEADKTVVATGSTVVFSDISQNEPAVWEWRFEGGVPETSAEQNPTVFYETAGKYDVTLTVTNNDATDTVVKENYIVVQESELYPIADFNADKTTPAIGETVIFANLSQKADRWEWRFEGGTPDFSEEENPSVIYAETGIFTVSLKVFNEYGEDEEVKEAYISVPQSISPNAGNGAVVVFPNPAVAGNPLHIQSEQEISTIELFNILGQPLRSVSANAKEYTLSDIPASPGIYILKITTKEGFFSFKLQVR